MPSNSRQGAYENLDFCREAFTLLETRVHKLVADAQATQSRDPARYVSGRLFLRLKHFLGFARPPPYSPLSSPVPTPGAAAAAGAGAGAGGASPSRPPSEEIGGEGEAAAVAGREGSPLRQRRKGDGGGGGAGGDGP